MFVGRFDREAAEEICEVRVEELTALVERSLLQPASNGGFAYLADPEFAQVPMQGLLSDDHATELAATIDRARATAQAGPGEPEAWVRFSAALPPGDPWRFDTAQRPAAPAG